VGLIDAEGSFVVTVLKNYRHRPGPGRAGQGRARMSYTSYISIKIT